MRSRVLYIFLIVIFVGCGVRPWGVLSQKEMVAVLLDVHMAESAMKVLDSGAKRIEKQEYYNLVFEKHNITKEQFDKSIDWYSRKHKVLMAIYEEVRNEAERLQDRVDNYEFHPDAKPSHEDSIAIIDLWHWERERLLSLDEDSVLSVDELHFSILDTNYFYKSEELNFYLKMRVYAPDTTSFTTRLICHFSDSSVDTLQYVSLADSVCRRYRFSQKISKYRDLDSLFIEFIDSVRTIEYIKIDSVELNRVYNRYLYPLKNEARKELTEANDSIKRINIAALKHLNNKSNKNK